jgi:mevalonate kinase
MARPAQASAPGKVILLGEHAVVYGQPALALPLDRGVRVQAEPASSLRLKTLPASGAAQVQEALSRLGEALGSPKVEVSIDSSIPLSAGLGSSAAVAVGLARALAAAADRTLTDDEVLTLAAGMEQHFHGQPSGIDHTTCALAVPLRFERGNPSRVKRLAVPPTQIVVVLSGPRVGTKEKVSALRQAYEREPERLSGVFAEIGRLAERGEHEWVAGRWNELGRLMNENQQILRSLGLSTPAIDALCERMRERGALGVKLTGAGGGGAMIALHPEPERLARELDESGVRSFVSAWEGRA